MDLRRIRGRNPEPPMARNGIIATSAKMATSPKVLPLQPQKVFLLLSLLLLPFLSFLPPFPPFLLLSQPAPLSGPNASQAAAPPSPGSPLSFRAWMPLVPRTLVLPHSTEHHRLCQPARQPTQQHLPAQPSAEPQGGQDARLSSRISGICRELEFTPAP